MAKKSDKSDAAGLNLSDDQAQSQSGTTADSSPEAASAAPEPEILPETAGLFVTRTSLLQALDGSAIARGRIVRLSSGAAKRLLAKGRVRPATARDVAASRAAFRQVAEIL